MVKFYGKSFRTSDFGIISHDKYSDFYAGSWQKSDSSVPLLLLRLVLAAVALAIMIWSLSGSDRYWLIYLTNWGVLITVAMLLSAVFVSYMAYSKKFPDNTDAPELPWYVIMYWVLFNTATPISFLITVLYWTLLYGTDIQNELSLEIATHGGLSILVLTDFLASRMPVYIAHLVQPLGFGIWYALFSYIYYASGGTDKLGNPYMYQVLNWQNATRSIGIIATSIATLIFIYMILWCIALCRNLASSKLFRSSSVKLEQAPPDKHSNLCAV